MTLCIDQAMQRNSTNGDGSNSFKGGPTRPVQSVRACSYSDFMKCQPLNFRGTEGVVGLSRWFEKMELVFYIRGCGSENQVTILKKKMTNKYCPRGEIKKLEIELWNLKVKGNNVRSYTRCFKELALMCTKVVSDEKEKVDKYIAGLPDNIHRNTESKRKFDNNNQAQQIPKRQNVAQAYAIRTSERKEYAGTLPLCNKYKFYHNGPCTTKISPFCQLGKGAGAHGVYGRGEGMIMYNSGIGNFLGKKGNSKWEKAGKLVRGCYV
uniref:Retrotransposon gag domain-containing protein n=1 Tax=Tanacetum cinerariifolium TaxID=118510 RepID=A0A6L2K842_TANCI|nr:hypothetical protein [Tanacetum cinerariifolium]